MSVRAVQNLLACAASALLLALLAYGQSAERPGTRTTSDGADPTADGKTDAETAVFATKMKVKGVPNFGMVSPTLFRGGQPSREGYKSLAAMGVDIVVDLRMFAQGGERNQVSANGMRFVQIPWYCSLPSDSKISQFLLLLHENPGKKVFVHCIKGDDRTGLEIAAYRMAEQGWSEPQAREEMEAFGFNFFHRRICTGLGAYETRFPQRFATSPAFQQVRDMLRAFGPVLPN
jgi:hypothetical protein